MADTNSHFAKELFNQEHALTRQLVEAALDASTSGIVVTDNRLYDNPIIYCNKSFQQLTGYNRDEIIGRNCRFLQGEDRSQPERKALRDSIHSGSEVRVDIKNYRKDGQVFYNELHIVPVKDQEGNVTHFIGTQHDVTRAVNAETSYLKETTLRDSKIKERTSALDADKEYLQSILETVRESLVVMDKGLKVITVNRHFLKTFEVTGEETEGRPFLELGNGQWNIPKLRELLLSILPTNNPVLDFEVEHNFPHIGIKKMLLNAHRIELEGEYKDRILLAIEDVTDRRAIEQRKDDFLEVASHELKTPLTSIHGYLQVLQKYSDKNTDPKMAAMVEKTLKQLDRLANLIKQLLEVNRLQRGAAELNKQTFNFGELVKDTVDNIRATMPTHTIEIQGKQDIACAGDEAQIAQVITNLLSNAIKYSPDADKILVKTEHVTNYVKFSVTDYGLGIASREQKRIFDRFYRVSETEKRFAGMGLGLYICSEIIKNHGGNLWVHSDPGSGSTFSFTLPTGTQPAK